MNIRHQTILLFLLLYVSIVPAQKLYIFYPAPIRPHIAQKKLTEAGKDFTIVVFGRYKDFIARVTIEKPDALLTKPDLLKQIPDFKKALSGKKEGKIAEPYVFLSIGQKIDTATIGNATVGTIDFLGRKGMDNLFASYFSTPPKIKRVTKVEDLLPLLSFRMASALFLCKDKVPSIKSKSKLDFVITELPNIRVGIIVFAVQKNRDSGQIIDSFKILQKEINTLYNIDGWK